MWLISFLFVLFAVSINGTERKTYEQKLAAVDTEITAFAHTALSEHFRHDKQMRATHIVQIKTAVRI